MQPCWPARPRVRTRTLRRLIGSSVVVGPTSVSRRHERPVSDGRQPTEREVEAAAVGGPATSQGGIRIRLASSRSSRRTWPAHCLVCQFGLAGLVSAGRRADAARLGGLREGPLGPTSAGPSAAAAPCWGARPQAKRRCVRGSCSWRRLAAYWPAPLLHGAVSWHTHRTVRLRSRSPRLVA